MTVSLGIGDVPSCRPSTTRLGRGCPDLGSDPDLRSGSEGGLVGTISQNGLWPNWLVGVTSQNGL